MSTKIPTSITAALLAAVLCPATKDGKPVMKDTKDGQEPVLRPVKPEEVLDFAVRDGEVTVVTVQGRKYSGPVPKGYKGPELEGGKGGEDR